MMPRILIIEDDPAIMKGLVESLAQEHYEVEQASDGKQGLELALGQGYDIIILDLILPIVNGEDICRAIRAAKNDTPILVLSSKTREMEKVLVLELGADDYLTKPFGMQELLARLRVLLRRRDKAQSQRECYEFGDVSIDCRKYELTRGELVVELSAREFSVLEYLINREGDVISRQQLLDEVWGYDSFPTTRTVDNYILALRKKIEVNPAEPKHLLTIHTVGYKFVSGD
ncbi:response regulator transcription factor [Candidatus Neomarinimicrobiota bacterium]